MYRRQDGKLLGDILGRLYCEYMFGIVLGFWVRNFIGTSLLVKIHIPRTQKWARGFTEPSRYGSVHEHLQLYKRNNYIYVNVIIYVYIRTHSWLYVVITTKVRYFLVRYFINAALLVIIHIPYTQKWAPGHTVPAVTDAIARL